MNSIAKTVSGAAGRLRARPQERREGYAPGGAPPLPLSLRIGRSWLGLAVLVLESLGMLALVLFMYFKG